MSVKASLRWLTKKAARAVVSYSWPSVHIKAAVDAGPRVRVLTYHRFVDRPGDVFSLSPQAFEAQIKYLCERGSLVSLAQIEDFVRGRCALPDRAVLITMDDGQPSMLTAARIMQRYAAPSVAFLCAGLIETDVTADGEPFMTWEQVRELQALGVTIGSHAFTHRSMGRLSPSEVRDEMLRSKTMLEQETQRGVTSFAYPFGTAGDCSQATDQIAADVGYRMVFHSKHGALMRGRLMHSYDRIKIESGESQRQFQRIVAGGMDAWRVVDDNLSALQRWRQEL